MDSGYRSYPERASGKSVVMPRPELLDRITPLYAIYRALRLKSSVRIRFLDPFWGNSKTVARRTQPDNCYGPALYERQFLLRVPRRYKMVAQLASASRLRQQAQALRQRHLRVQGAGSLATWRKQRARRGEVPDEKHSRETTEGDSFGASWGRQLAVFPCGRDLGRAARYSKNGARRSVTFN